MRSDIVLTGNMTSVSRRKWYTTSDMAQDLKLFVKSAVFWGITPRHVVISFTDSSEQDCKCQAISTTTGSTLLTCYDHDSTSQPRVLARISDRGRLSSTLLLQTPTNVTSVVTRDILLRRQLIS